MKAILDDIQSGKFVKDWMLENRVNQTSFKAMRAKCDNHRDGRGGQALARHDAVDRRAQDGRQEQELALALVLLGVIPAKAGIQYSLVFVDLRIQRVLDCPVKPGNDREGEGDAMLITRYAKIAMSLVLAAFCLLVDLRQPHRLRHQLSVRAARDEHGHDLSRQCADVPLDHQSRCSGRSPTR